MKSLCLIALESDRTCPIWQPEKMVEKLKKPWSKKAGKTKNPSTKVRWTKSPLATDFQKGGKYVHNTKAKAHPGELTVVNKFWPILVASFALDFPYFFLFHFKLDRLVSFRFSRARNLSVGSQFYRYRKSIFPRKFQWVAFIWSIFRSSKLRRRHNSAHNHFMRYDKQSGFIFLWFFLLQANSEQGT